jgi:hypothetical protein
MRFECFLGGSAFKMMAFSIGRSGGDASSDSESRRIFVLQSKTVDDMNTTGSRPIFQGAKPLCAPDVFILP